MRVVLGLIILAFPLNSFGQSQNPIDIDSKITVDSEQANEEAFADWPLKKRLGAFKAFNESTVVLLSDSRLSVASIPGFFANSDRVALINTGFPNDGRLFIFDLNSKTMHGWISFNISQTNPTVAIIDILLNEVSQGKGIGTHTMNLLIETVFARYPYVQSINNMVTQDNFSSRKMHTKLGFLSDKSSRMILHRSCRYLLL